MAKEVQRKVIDMDSVNKGLATTTAVVGVVFTAYLHITSIIDQVESRVIELEKQNLRNDKYIEYTMHSKDEIRNIQNDLRSLNDTTMELMRMLRTHELDDERRIKK